jgi:hypothetical protein
LACCLRGWAVVASRQHIVTVHLTLLDRVRRSLQVRDHATPGRPTFAHTADITTCQILDLQLTTGTNSQAHHQGSKIFAAYLVHCQAHAYYVGNCLYALLAAKATESDPSRRPVRKLNPGREIVGRRIKRLLRPDVVRKQPCKSPVWPGLGFGGYAAGALGPYIAARGLIKVKS